MMGTEQVTAIRHICDGCGKVKLQEPQEAPPLGFSGQVERIVESKGSVSYATGLVDFYACGVRCIRKAVENAIANNKVVDQSKFIQSEDPPAEDSH